MILPVCFLATPVAVVSTTSQALHDIAVRSTTGRIAAFCSLGRHFSRNPFSATEDDHRGDVYLQESGLISDF
jgi:hypothetical protein